MGNLFSKRDWGHAKDYVRAMHLILQQPEPDDYVIATGVTTEIREFIQKAFNELGITIEFRGQGENEIGKLAIINEILFTEKLGTAYLENLNARLKNNPVVVKVDPAYFRPAEVDLLIGDPTKSKQKLGWEPSYDLDELIKDMVESDVKLMKKEKYLKDGGYDTLNYFE